MTDTTPLAFALAFAVVAAVSFWSKRRAPIELESVDVYDPVKEICVYVDALVGPPYVFAAVAAGPTIMGMTASDEIDWRKTLLAFLTELRSAGVTKDAKLRIVAENTLGLRWIVDARDYVLENFENVEFIDDGGRKPGVTVTNKIRRAVFEHAKRVWPTTRVWNKATVDCLDRLKYEAKLGGNKYVGGDVFWAFASASYYSSLT
jgi:hypothetical protein